jgi:hypothetical protein
MKRIFALLLVLGTLGCAQKSTLYSWGSYETQTYNYFKGESPEAQLLILEKQKNESTAKGQALPPGFHAHMALLYEKTGKPEDMRQMFETEKKLYPESSTYINHLLSNFKRLK